MLKAKPCGNVLLFESRLCGYRIRILRLDGVAARDVKAKFWARSILSTGRGRKGLLLFKPSPQGVTLLHIDLDGNVQALWTQKGSFGTSAIPSPDGKRLAIWGATLESNVWMIENF
jgi:hypothetical protein